MHSSPTKLSYADYARIPEDGKRHEILGGAHYVNPAPSFYHQSVSARLLADLLEAIERRGKGRVVAAPVDVQLSEHDIVQPDLVVILEANTKIITPSKVEGSPDLLIEILSPSSVRHDRERKHRLYAHSGVREFWIVDPSERAVEQFVLEGAAYTLRAKASDAISVHVEQGVRIDFSRVW